MDHSTEVSSRQVIARCSLVQLFFFRLNESVSLSRLVYLADEEEGVRVCDDKMI